MEMLDVHLRMLKNLSKIQAWTISLSLSVISNRRCIIITNSNSTSIPTIASSCFPWMWWQKGKGFKSISDERGK